MSNQYEGMHKRKKKERKLKEFYLFNKKEFEKVTKNLNNEMDEVAEEFLQKQ